MTVGLMEPYLVDSKVDVKAVHLVAKMVAVMVVMMAAHSVG